MRRRDFIAGLAGTTAGWTLAARAQQPTVPMIGFVDAGSADASADNIPQKVVLYEEDPRDSAGKSYVGSAVWRTEVVPPGPGQKPNIAARADIEIPAQNISIGWSLRRNAGEPHRRDRVHAAAGFPPRRHLQYSGRADEAG